MPPFLPVGDALHVGLGVRVLEYTGCRFKRNAVLPLVESALGEPFVVKEAMRVDDIPAMGAVSL